MRTRKGSLKFLCAILLALPTLAFSLSSQEQLSLTFNHAPLEVVLEEINSQSGYRFFYEQNVIDLNRKVTLYAKEATLTFVLEELFKNTNVAYKFEKKQIVLTRKPLKQVQRIIKGTVTDQNKTPLFGVTIRIKGQNEGVTTDLDGNYSIQASSGDILVFRFLGMQTQEVTVTDQQEINLSLSEQINKLDQVTVVSTGYQQIEKDQLTGAASVVSSQELEQRTIVSGNIFESIEGKLPGVVYTGRNPNTPEGEQLTIRGIATFDGVKSPLIVLDGYPTEANLSSINPNTIASVSVLRDAAASSIYGARAANGVIVIETKKGAQGKPVLSFRNSVAIQSSPDFRQLNYADSREYIAVKKERALASTRSRPSTTAVQLDPVEAIVYDFRDGIISQDQMNNRLHQLGNYNNLDQYNDLFYRASIIQNYEIAMSGGGDSHTYRIGVNYIGNSKNEKLNDQNRVIVNLHNMYQISDRFTLELSGIYSHEKTTRRGVIPSYSSLLPYQPIVDANGNSLPDLGAYSGSPAINNQGINLGLYDRWRYPYKDYLTEHNSAKSNTIRGQFNLNTKLFDWLNLDIGGAMEQQRVSSDQLYEEENFLVRDLLNRSAQQDPSTGGPLFTHIPKGDILKKGENTLFAYTFRAQLNFDIHLGENQNHRLSGILGAEVRKKENETFLNSYFGYDGQRLLASPIDLQLLETRQVRSGFPELAFGTPRLNTSTYFNELHSDRRFRSYFSQLTYQFNKKYIVTGSIRVDQSNLFGTDPSNRNKPQWSIGASWLVHQEGFLNDASQWLNQLKLRGSFGLTGNVPRSNSGRFLILNTGQRRDLIPSTINNRILAPENESLRWEDTENINLGLDLGFFNNRLSATFDWYKKTTVDVLGNTLADPTTGFNSYYSNTASIENRGIELWINSKNVQSNFVNWNTSITASFNTNEVIEVYNDNLTSFRSNYYFDSNNPYISYPLNTLISFNYAGLNEMGIPTIIDHNGERKMIGSSDEILLEDMIESGTTTPKYVVGLSNQLNIGDFSLYAMLMYYGGHVTRVQQPTFEDDFPLQGVSNYWKAPGDENTTAIAGQRPAFSEPNYSEYSFGNTIYRYADRYVIDADQIRLTDLVFTYNLPEDALRNIKLFQTQLRFQIQNLWNYNFADNDIDSDAINPFNGIRELQKQPIYSFSLITQF